MRKIIFCALLLVVNATHPMQPPSEAKDKAARRAEKDYQRCMEVCQMLKTEREMGTNSHPFPTPTAELDRMMQANACERFCNQKKYARPTKTRFGLAEGPCS
jgi:hypothetical protein